MILAIDFTYANISSMELRQLRYFVTALELKSISKAAHACHIAQPSMSQQIAALENELGVTLLNRSSRGVTSTPAGERILEQARSILIAADHLEQSARQQQPLTGILRIGIIPTIAPFIISKLIQTMKELHPMLDLEIIEDQTSALVQAFGRNEIECAIVSDVKLKDRKTWSISLKELTHEPLLLALPHTHRLATQKKAPSVNNIPPDELIHLKDGHCLMDQVLKACRLKRQDAHLKCDQLDSALAMVSAGAGIAVVPELATHRHKEIEGVTIRKFCAPEPSRVISLMLHRNDKNALISQRLIDALSGIFQA